MHTGLYLQAIAQHHKTVDSPTKPRTRKLLTGNEVEELRQPVDIVISTKCPKKWVLVDLETGEQFGCTGETSRSNNTVAHVAYSQRFINPIRKVSIPRPKK